MKISEAQVRILRQNDVIEYEEKDNIITLDEKGDIGEFITKLKEKDPEVENYLDQAVEERLTELLSKFNYPITVVYESYYVDRVYRDEYYRFYSKKHFNISKNTKRLTFFQNKYEKCDFINHQLEKHKQIEENLIGTIILKPSCNVGRILIDPEKIDLPTCFIQTAVFNISILGNTYMLRAFPLSGQDSEVMTCAEVNVWQIMEYFGTKYSDYKVLLPSEMVDQLYSSSPERILPSEGLSEEQESLLFVHSGLSPKIYYYYLDSNDNISEEYKIPKLSFYELLNIYVSSGLPILVNLTEPENEDGEHHTITVIGRKNFGLDFELLKNKRLSLAVGDLKSKYKDLFVSAVWKQNDDFVIMEDHSAPYKVLNCESIRSESIQLVEKDAITWKINNFLVPLYKNVYMLAEDAYQVVMQILINISEEVIDAINGNELFIRLFLVKSNAYKEFRVKNACIDQERVFFSCADYPKYLWVCEYGTSDSFSRKKAVGEVVLDATSSKCNEADSIISLRQTDNITYRGPYDPIDTAFSKRDVQIDKEFTIFEGEKIEPKKGGESNGKFC